MGQYHTVAAFTDDDSDPIYTIEHYDLAAGAKLVEQAYTYPERETGIVTPSPYASAFGLMMLGPWSSCRVVVIGDYADESCNPIHWDRVLNVDSYYGSAEHNDLLTDQTELAQNLLGEAMGYSFTDDDGMRWKDTHPPTDLANRLWAASNMPSNDELVLVCTNGEYLEPAAFGTPGNPMASVAVGALWPMAYMLLAVSDGRGGGDAGFDIPGRWAYNKLGFAPRANAQRNACVDITDWALRQREVGHLLAT